METNFELLRLGDHVEKEITLFNTCPIDASWNIVCHPKQQVRNPRLYIKNCFGFSSSHFLFVNIIKYNVCIKKAVYQYWLWYNCQTTSVMLTLNKSNLHRNLVYWERLFPCIGIFPFLQNSFWDYIRGQSTLLLYVICWKFRNQTKS